MVPNEGLIEFALPDHTRKEAPQLTRVQDCDFPNGLEAARAFTSTVRLRRHRLLGPDDEPRGRVSSRQFGAIDS